MKIGIAAAGSGGHVYPALAVAGALVELGLSPNDIHFFGGDRMEKQIIPEAGFPFLQLDIHGFRRSLSIENALLPFKVYRATQTIVTRIESEEIRAMIVFGGYVSGPAGLAARRVRIPLILHEANAVPGLANRMLAPFADLNFAAFEPAREKLRRVEVVGNPLRPAFEHFERGSLQADARLRYGIDPEATVLGVFGGSLGAAALNDIAAKIAVDPGRRFHLLHLAGTPHYETVAARASSVDHWTVLPFESEMEYLYAVCDLVICRSGALTVSELSATATPAILVPLPAGKAYQGRNAEDLVKSRAGIVINQESESKVIATALQLLKDPGRLSEMSNASPLSRKGSVSHKIARDVLEVAGG